MRNTTPRTFSALALTVALLLPPEVGQAREPGSVHLYEEAIAEDLAADRPGHALALCETLAAEYLSPVVRRDCARAALKVGDRMASVGQRGIAQKRWEQALDFDPSLSDAPDVLARLNAPSDRPRRTSALPPPRRIESEDGSWALGPPEAPEPSEVADGDGFFGTPGPRFGRRFSVGLGVGYVDGGLGLTVGWRSWEHVHPELSVGLLVPTVDIRVRFLALRESLTPVLGLGIIVPFDAQPRSGDLGMELQSLYELGESFHLDLGVMWNIVEGLDLFVGLSFVTPFDQTHPDTVVFFPQLTAGLGWAF